MDFLSRSGSECSKNNMRMNRIWMVRHFKSTNRAINQIDTREIYHKYKRLKFSTFTIHLKMYKVVNRVIFIWRPP